MILPYEFYFTLLSTNIYRFFYLTPITFNKKRLIERQGSRVETNLVADMPKDLLSTM